MSLSRSVISNLKIFLLIDLIIVGIAAGAYFYFQDQSVITGAARPAEFVFTDLVVSPLETFVGRPIHISVNVTNIGDIEGSTVVNLEINGSAKDSVDITLMALRLLSLSNLKLSKLKQEITL